MLTQNEIIHLGEGLLNGNPNAIVRYRLLRDVLHIPQDDHQLRITRGEMQENRWIQDLASAQEADGSWGRFHSMDTKNKRKFPSSEYAIRRALALGLEKESPIFKRAVVYMEKVLAGEIAWSDRVEKSEGWPIGIEAITSGTLAQVDVDNPAITKAWEYWVEVANRSFRAGKYDQKVEWNAHKEMRGLGIIYLRSRYVLCLLGARARDLPSGLARTILAWIWLEPGGIGYLGADLKHPDPFHISQWLESHEILSRFPI